MAHVTLKDVTKIYDGDVLAVQQANFEIPDESFTVQNLIVPLRPTTERLASRAEPAPPRNSSGSRHLNASPRCRMYCNAPPSWRLRMAR